MPTWTFTDNQFRALAKNIERMDGYTKQLESAPFWEVPVR